MAMMKINVFASPLIFKSLSHFLKNQYAESLHTGTSSVKRLT